MLLVVIVIGLILIVAALRNTQGVLFGALAQDIPPYVVWAAALLAVGVIGYVKPLKGISDALIVLILTVIIVNNYKAILAGVQGVATSGGGAASGSAPAADAGTAISNTSTGPLTQQQASGLEPVSSTLGSLMTGSAPSIDDGVPF